MILLRKVLDISWTILKKGDIQTPKMQDRRGLVLSLYKTPDFEAMIITSPSQGNLVATKTMLLLFQLKLVRGN